MSMHPLKALPNTLTLINLCSGVLALVLILENQVEWVFLCLAISLVADFLDGFMARILKATGPLGIQLDSLADLISFGLMPVILFYHTGVEFGNPNKTVLIISCLIFVACAAFRLAKFNILDSDTTDFSGMPSPAAGVTVASICIPFFYTSQGMELYFSFTAGFSIIPIVLGFLMVSPLRFISLKFSNFSFLQNRFRYLVLLGSVVLFLVFQLQSLPMIMLWYIICSGVSNFKI